MDGIHTKWIPDILCSTQDSGMTEKTGVPGTTIPSLRDFHALHRVPSLVPGTHPYYHVRAVVLGRALYGLRDMGKY